MNSPPPSTYESTLTFLKLSPSLKGLVEDANKRNGTSSYLFLPECRAKGANHELQAPFGDHLRNEMEFIQLYESICVGF